MLKNKHMKEGDNRWHQEIGRNRVQRGCGNHGAEGKVGWVYGRDVGKG